MTSAGHFARGRTPALPHKPAAAVHNHPVARREPTHCCPRCGYDLSGAVETWTDQCPVEGVCPECGLNYPWRKVLNADFRVDPLFCETATTHLMRALFTTPLRALRPWSFWRWVKMEYRFRLARVATALAVWFAAVWALQFVAFLAASWLIQRRIPGGAGLSWNNRPILAHAAYPGFFGYAQTYSENYTAMIALAAWMALTGVMYLIMGTTLARAKASTHHIVRITGYQYVALAFAWLATQYALNADVWYVMLYTMYTPNPYQISSPAIELVLRSRALVLQASVFAIPAWLALYWGFACSRYLRIRRPWLVAIVMLLTSGLAVFTALMYYILAPGWFL